MNLDVSLKSLQKSVSIGVWGGGAGEVGQFSVSKEKSPSVLLGEQKPSPWSWTEWCAFQSIDCLPLCVSQSFFILHCHHYPGGWTFLVKFSVDWISSPPRMRGPGVESVSADFEPVPCPPVPYPPPSTPPGASGSCILWGFCGQIHFPPSTPSAGVWRSALLVPSLWSSLLFPKIY